MSHTFRVEPIETKQREAARPHRSQRRARASIKRQGHRAERRGAKAEIRAEVMSLQGEG